MILHELLEKANIIQNFPKMLSQSAPPLPEAFRKGNSPFTQQLCESHTEKLPPACVASLSFADAPQRLPPDPPAWSAGHLWHLQNLPSPPAGSTSRSYAAAPVPPDVPDTEGRVGLELRLPGTAGRKKKVNKEHFD